jgi:hypothetical protein
MRNRCKRKRSSRCRHPANVWARIVVFVQQVSKQSTQLQLRQKLYARTDIQQARTRR